jgi:hypothetical protein
VGGRKDGHREGYGGGFHLDLSLPDFVVLADTAPGWGVASKEEERFTDDCGETLSRVQVQQEIANRSGKRKTDTKCHVPFLFLWAGQRPIYERETSANRVKVSVGPDTRQSA